MELCPRCMENRFDAEPERYSLSRRDNSTPICNDCGMEEAMIDGGYTQVTGAVLDREARMGIG